MLRFLMTMGLIVSLSASAGAAVDLCVNGDFSYGDETGWAHYTEAWGAQDYDWDVSNGIGTLSLTSGTLCWYQVMDVPAGLTVNCSGEWMSTMTGNNWWAEIMLFSFEDMQAECIDNHGSPSTCLAAAIDQPGTIDGDVVDGSQCVDNGGVGGMAFKKDAWGLNQSGSTWSWEACADSPMGDSSIESLGQVAIVLKLGGGKAQGGVSFDNITLVAPAIIPGDLNMDGMVGSADLDIVRSHWGEEVAPGSLGLGDPSKDGVVGSADLDIVRANWGATASATAVPEPACIAILLAGCACLCLRGRRI